MRYLFALGSLLLAIAPCAAQNVAIAPLLSRPEHEFNQVPGCPTNWPVIVDRIGTNSVSPFPGRTVLRESDLADLYTQVGATFTNWHKTTWANFITTNAAAADVRRLQLLLARRQVVNALEGLTNAVDFTAATAPLLISNLVRLQQIDTRLGQ